MLTAQQQERLQTRVAIVIQDKRHLEFTATELAKTLAADKYDVLHALHCLKASKHVEQLTTSADAIFSDRWRLTPYAVYIYSPIHAQSVAEAL